MTDPTRAATTSPTEKSPPLRVVVCVATYRRPAGLQRLLGALDAQVFSDPPPQLRVIVIDNDAEGSARQVCDAAAGWLSLPLTYAIEKRRGISQARNAALVTAFPTAEFAAFIDDDEVPERDWLDQLLRAQRRQGADAVTGPCLPRFSTTPPDWLVAGGFFERPQHNDGAGLSHCYTHNALVRCAALEALDALFDERLALTGGEDVELFERLAAAGYAIVWAAGAVVHDCIPPERATASWVLRRAFRTGSSSANIARLRGLGLPATVRLLAHGSYCVARGGLELLAAPLRGRTAALSALRLVCWGAGRLWGACGGRFEAYRDA